MRTILTWTRNWGSNRNWYLLLTSKSRTKKLKCKSWPKMIPNKWNKSSKNKFKIYRRPSRSLRRISKAEMAWYSNKTKISLICSRLMSRFLKMRNRLSRNLKIWWSMWTKWKKLWFQLSRSNRWFKTLNKASNRVSMKWKRASGKD